MDDDLFAFLFLQRVSISIYDYYQTGTFPNCLQHLVFFIIVIIITIVVLSTSTSKFLPQTLVFSCLRR